MEQTGRVQLAKFKLIEEVVELPTADAGFDLAAGAANFLLRISGPHASMANIVSSEALALGGSFKLTFALSANGIIWSDERSLEFRIEDGKLLPVEKS
jgi:hypothetical protein